MSKDNLKESENTFHVKLLTAGETDCGKTCFIKRYCEQRFEPKYVPTIGIDYGIKKLKSTNFVLAVS